jgi:PEP-CTERM/exosortase A-associated glycosyltransferase
MMASGRSVSGEEAMRILHVLDHSVPLHSGYSFRTLAILERQWARGWETAQVTSAKHAADVLEEDVDGVKFYRTPRLSRTVESLALLAPLAVIRGLTRRLRELVPVVRPHILHAHSPSLNGVAALRVGRHFGIPVVYEVRALWEDGAVDHGTILPNGWRYRAMRTLETYVLRRADAVTTICTGLQREILTRGVPRAQVTVIPNGVDVARFGTERTATAGLAYRLGLAGMGPVLGYIGSFYAYEGLALLLKSFPVVLARQPGSRVLLVGGGPQEEALRHQARELGIADKVIFAGRIPHEEIPAYYDVIDVLVYPRRRNRLTEIVTPLKPLEAMARGHLVVASDVGGHRELIRHGETGVLFAAGDPTALARTVLGLWADVDRWQAIRSAARRFVEVERTWQQSVDRYTAVYGGLLGSRYAGVA